MIAYPKRLIEVDLPIRRISEHARREKSIRHGHISTLHIWWARRPLAACRAVVCAALWPDPADPHCPQAFRDKAARLINDFASKAASSKDLAEHCSQQNWAKWQSLVNKGGIDSSKEPHWNVLRFALLDFIADFANWDNSTVPEYLETSRALTKSAHEALGGAPGTRPLVVDSFAGGGSIPLEALRVGADAFASDLNPVSVLLNKVILEYIPKYGQRLADHVRKWAEWMYGQLEQELREFYPKTKEGHSVGAYLWARTIISEAPGGGDYPIEVPLMRSMLLLKKQHRYQALRWVRDRKGQVETEVDTVTFADGKTMKVRRPLLEIFQPSSPAEVERGTSSGGAATCPVTGYTTSVESVRRQLMARRGGAEDARLVCVVATNTNISGRLYLPPTSLDMAAACRAATELKRQISEHLDNVSLVPDGQLNHLRGFFNVVLYGMTTWGDLFSPRQLLGLTSLVKLLHRVAPDESDPKFRGAVQTCLALAIDRCADKCASLVVWDNTRDMATHVFGRQALPMIWDFAEVSFLSDNGWNGAADWVVRVIDATAESRLPEGAAANASATKHPLPDDTVDAVVTDPPYYAAIPYADLSDFFYSWLKRSVGHLYPDLFSADLSPKDDECVSLSHRAAMYRNKDSTWFEQTMTKACAENRRIAKPAGIGVFVFANKETAGWEAMLGALIGSGWIITGSWPVDTEMGNRLRAQNSAALASSVHLVCRPRENFADSVDADEIGDWRDVLQELPARIHEWMPRLAEEGVVGADAIFACLGPALEIFSRYTRVEKASGEQVMLKEYLEYVWAAVAKEALNKIFEGADATGFEEDSRLTAMWLWTRSTAASENGSAIEGELHEEQEEEESAKKPQTGGFVLEYDAARKIAQGLGAHLERLTTLIEVSGDKARLLPVAERARHLFGKDQGTLPAHRKAQSKQLSFAEFLKEVREEDGVGDRSVARIGDTVLDRVHQSMILFAAGRNEALKRFLVNDGAGQDQRFWRLAQALSALYPTGTDERRWVEGVLARKKGLGF
jgi:adenine-specific DNA methylase